MFCWLQPPPEYFSSLYWHTWVGLVWRARARAHRRWQIVFTIPTISVLLIPTEHCRWKRRKRRRMKGGRVENYFNSTRARRHTRTPSLLPQPAVSWCNTPEHGAVINNSRGCLHRSTPRLLYSCDLFLPSFFFSPWHLKNTLSVKRVKTSRTHAHIGCTLTHRLLCSLLFSCGTEACL